VNTIRSLAALPGLLLLASCAGGGGLGTLGDVLGGAGGVGGTGGAQSGQLRAEIDRVDASGQRIHVRTESGQSGSLLYDPQTEVFYRQQQYPVTALERGDLVTIEAQQTQGNELYARTVYVDRSVQERTGSSGIQQIEGRVGQIDYQRGTFVLQTQSAGGLLVFLPYNPPASVEERFARLRMGDSVRVEGQLLPDGRVELLRFP